MLLLIVSDIARDEVECIRYRSLWARGFSNCILPPLCGLVIDLVSQRRGKLISEGP